MVLLLGAFFLKLAHCTWLRLANKTTKSQPNCFWSNLFLSENPTSNNSFQILINFSLVFKITPKVGVRPIPLQHKLELLVIHFFWREMCDVTCNLPISNFSSVWENLLQKLSVCFNKSIKSKLCLVQQFFSDTKDSKKDVRMLRMISGVKGLPSVETKHFLMSEAWNIMNFCRRVRLSIIMFTKKFCNVCFVQ